MSLARTAIVMLAALSAGCAVQQAGPYRDLYAPIGVTTRFTVADFAGPWTVWQAFGPETGGNVRFEAIDGLLRVSGPGAVKFAGQYREGKAGELIPTDEDRETLVVMWVDEDFETAAIGTVSGSFGAILDRDGVVPKDRAQAARDILTFYGWDISALERTAL